MTDPRRTYPSNPATYGSGYPPAAAASTQPQTGQGQAGQVPLPPSQTPAPATLPNYQQAVHCSPGGTVFYYSPQPGTMPSPAAGLYHPGPRPPTPAHPTYPAYHTPPMPAGHLRTAPVPMPGAAARAAAAGPPTYSYATQGYTCPDCGMQVPPQNVESHKLSHKKSENRQPVGLGFGPQFFARRDDEHEDKDNSGSDVGSAARFYANAWTTSTTRR